MRSSRALIPLLLLAALPSGAAQSAQDFPREPLKFGAFTSRFATDGAFSLSADDWGTYIGRWERRDASTIELTFSGLQGCDRPGQYTFTIEDRRLHLALVSDLCATRKLILDRSVWTPAAEARRFPERKIVRTVVNSSPLPRNAGPSSGSWTSFRGNEGGGVADGQNLPDIWNVQTGENILWRTPIPGLGHSSPIVWGQRMFVTSAISSNPNATFRPGLYGDGDASDDRSRQRWMVYALDKNTGKLLWERVALEAAPIDKRHIKSTYASSTPVTDGRIVIAWFGSHGIFAYDMEGNLKWKVDLGRLDTGAYDLPSYEWGPASSPVIWNGLAIFQCDTQADSFIIALNAHSGETVWKTDRNELPSWSTPIVADTSEGPVLLTNAPNSIRGYDPRTGKELWRLGGSSKITAPSPIFGDNLFVISSGRQPERPIFAVRASARGDITLSGVRTSSDAIAWSRTARGPYISTPLIYRGLLYVLANNGVFDAYHLRSGAEIYRQRLPNIGNGFSASPVAADGKIYLASEDGEIAVVAAGETFRQIAANSMGDLIMATPAISEGVMYTRTAKAIFAIGKRKR